MTAPRYRRYKGNRVLDADIAPSIYNVGLASRPYLAITAMFYVLSSSMYFVLMVPTYMGYDGIAVPITYGAAQWFHGAATWLAPGMALLLCLMLVAAITAVVSLLLDYVRSLIEDHHGK
jgi:hypothetical protein